MLQGDPNGTQHKKIQQNWSSTFSEQGWTNGQSDKVTKPTRTPFPGSDLGSERAESDNELGGISRSLNGDFLGPLIHILSQDCAQYAVHFQI